MEYQRADVCYSNPVMLDYRAEVAEDKYNRYMEKKALAVVKIDFEPENAEHKLQAENNGVVNSSLRSKINKAQPSQPGEPPDMSSSSDNVNVNFHIKKLPPPT